MTGQQQEPSVWAVAVNDMDTGGPGVEPYPISEPPCYIDRVRWTVDRLVFHDRLILLRDGVVVGNDGQMYPITFSQPGEPIIVEDVTVELPQACPHAWHSDYQDGRVCMLCQERR
jgi:hypothetical protein